MLKKWKKLVLRGLLGISAVVFLASSYYVYKNYPRKAHTFEITTGTPGARILIATQGSDFKNQFVTNLCDSLKPSASVIKTVELKDLKEVKDSDWDRILIINSFIVKLNRRVDHFIDQLSSPEKVLLLVTSGGADWKPRPAMKLDAITSASQLANSEEVLSLTMDWLAHDISQPWMPKDCILALLFFPRMNVDIAISRIQNEREKYESRYANLESLIHLIGNFFLRLNDDETAQKIFKLNTDLYS